MSWKLIKSIQQKEADLRLILPFGLNLRLGDVISVDKNGTFTLEGSLATVLGMSAGTPRTASPSSVNLTLQNGKDTQCEFRSAGTASSTFENLPKASAGIDISFGSAEGWILAITGRAIHSLEEVNQFRQRILDAYSRGVWKADWAMVTSISTVEAMTLLAARNADTKIALTIAGEVKESSTLEAKLTAGISIMATNKEITQCVISQRMPAFCSAIRVRDQWWSTPGFGTLAVGPAVARNFDEATHEASCRWRHR